MTTFFLGAAFFFGAAFFLAATFLWAGLHLAQDFLAGAFFRAGFRAHFRAIAFFLGAAFFFARFFAKLSPPFGPVPHPSIAQATATVRDYRAQFPQNCKRFRRSGEGIDVPGKGPL